MGNASSTTTIIAAMTTSETKKPYPFHVEVEPKDSGLSKKGIVLLEQIQTISKSKLGALAGKLSQAKMSAVDLALKHSLELK
jgi:mRNA-degrading endonuclease toxin of MazEF toxin-antitoxin module